MAALYRRLWYRVGRTWIGAVAWMLNSWFARSATSFDWVVPLALLIVVFILSRLARNGPPRLRFLVPRLITVAIIEIYGMCYFGMCYLGLNTEIPLTHLRRLCLGHDHGIRIAGRMKKVRMRSSWGKCVFPVPLRTEDAIVVFCSCAVT